MTRVNASNVISAHRQAILARLVPLVKNGELPDETAKFVIADILASSSSLDPSQISGVAGALAKRMAFEAINEVWRRECRRAARQDRGPFRREPR